MRAVVYLLTGTALLSVTIDTSVSYGADPPVSLADLPVNRWVKLSPLPGGPPSPRLGYEGACVWDTRHRVLLRYGGHNQGGGGEQHAEMWSFDPLTAVWKLHLPNLRPPGICCGQENVFDRLRGKYVRFPAFSHSHGWQWLREIYLNNSSVWSYDLEENRWREMRPYPAPHPKPLRCASWDSHHRVIVLFGGEGSREGTWIYDPARNEWRKANPPVEPEPRSAGNMVYDARHRLHILFGSQFGDDPHTWAYDLAENRWIDMKPDRMPPTERNDAVLAYDSIHHVVLALVKSREDIDREKAGREGSMARLETWCYDTGKNAWTRLQPSQSPDPSSNRSRQLMFAPQYNVFLLENRTRNTDERPAEQQIWAYRYAGTFADGVEPPMEDANPPSAQPPLVEDVVVSVLATNHVEVDWRAAESDAVQGYVVERAVVEVYSTDQLVHLKSRTPPLDEPSVGAIARVGRFRAMTDQPIHETHWRDASIDLSRPAAITGEPLYKSEIGRHHLDADGRPYRYAVYAYRVRAVDTEGRPGGPSPAVFTIPAAVEELRSREDGKRCRLRWRANRERGIVGYRVYRIDGRWTKQFPVSRLTPKPLTECEYVDTTAADRTRRYHVIAIDAIGQEGHPSPPVWYRREWQRFYRPFVGEWHQ